MSQIQSNTVQLNMAQLNMAQLNMAQLNMIQLNMIQLNMIIQKNIKINQMYQTYIQHLIKFQLNQILYIQQKIKRIQNIENLNNIVQDTLEEEEDQDNQAPIFTRISTDTIKCSLCDKYASYNNLNSKTIYYCWFHRSQYENNM